MANLNKAKALKSASLQDSLHRICEAVHFSACTDEGRQCHFNNKAVVTGVDHGFATASEKRSEHPITLALRDTLYQYCFTHKLDPNSTAIATRVVNQQSTAFFEDMTAQLSSANQGQASWEPGWLINSINADGTYTVIRKGILRSVHASEFASTEINSQTLNVGSTVALYRPSESTHWQSGFYFAFGKTGQDDFDCCELVRIYWNIEPEGAPGLVSEVTREFNRYQIPFRFKCTNLRSLSQRIDTAVLYVPISNFRLSVSLSLHIRYAVHRWMRESVPLFTHELAPGLSFAQNPDTESSFGMERCLRLARAIIHTHKLQAKPKLEQVIKQLKADGLNMEKPHLNPGFPDLFSHQLTEINYEYAS